MTARSVVTPPDSATVSESSGADAGVISMLAGAGGAIVLSGFWSEVTGVTGESVSFMFRFVSTVVRNSSLARLNSRIARPIILPSSGSFDGPKTINANTMMRSISWKPTSNMDSSSYPPPARFSRGEEGGRPLRTHWQDRCPRVIASPSYPPENSIRYVLASSLLSQGS